VCIVYAALVKAKNKPEFAEWFNRLGKATAALPNQDDKPLRLALLQGALIDLIGLLDPKYLRFPDRDAWGRLVSASPLSMGQAGILGGLVYNSAAQRIRGLGGA
jgi:hypothetical protein